jgi:antitoxin component of MazEF toxin-antitoxin module
LTEGARVDVEASEDGRIIITRSRRRFTLDELLAGMTPDKEHPSTDDAPRGEEII